MTLRTKLVYFLIVVAVNYSPAQEWQNPSERYLRAYEQYLDATCPVPVDKIRHFVYFARDRRAMVGHPFLEVERFAGAQIMYPWSLLEPRKGTYDFSIIESDLAYLRSKGKALWIQLQDATFFPANKAVPPYLLSDEFDGGVERQVTEEGRPEGWVAKRWNPKVQERFARLLKELGTAFDGRIAGINLQETAIGMSHTQGPTYSPEAYAAAIKVNMQALKTAFPTTDCIQYANFMPGEWLPWEDKGYLRSIYAFGKKIGVGLGGPDLMVQRKAQLNHALALMHEGSFEVPLGIAVQDGNYTGRTGADFPLSSDGKKVIPTENPQPNTVPLLHAFAKDFLHVDYIFWSCQEPTFEAHVLPCFQE
jgi:hypothetical protein